MSWQNEHARPISRPLVAPGIRFTLWDYASDAPDDRISTNDDHVISMLLARPCDARVRHDLGGGFSPFGQLGSLLMTPAEVPIHTVGTPLRAKIARLEVDRGRYPHLERLTGERPPEQLARCISIANRDIEAAMHRLVREARGPGPAAELLVEGLCSTIVVELLRYLDLDGGRDRTAHGIGFTRQELRRLTDFVDSNLERRIAVAELARLTGISERHFTRRFHATTGQSVRAFVDQARLRHARELLSDPEHSIKQVAFRTGFASPAGFSDAFLRQTGERPAAFRRRMTAWAN